MRRHVRDMLLSDKTPVIGNHLPFLASAFVETRDAGFRRVQISNQWMG